MLNGSVHPTSLTGVKRLARQIRNASGVPFAQALDLAAKAAGAENYGHFRRGLIAANDASARYPLLITYYWRERKPYRAGRETLEIQLSRPLLEICAKGLMNSVRGLSGMRLVAPDHLVCDFMGQSQDYARGEVCRAARGLRFMEATGLRPGGFRDARAARKSLDCELPDNDHASDWVDPETGGYILVDEPYSAAVISDERSEWAERNNWQIRCSAKQGMYNPPYCSLFIATSKVSGFDIDGLLAKIDGMDSPITSEQWIGESAIGHETFLSPLAVTPQDRRRARAQCTIYREPSARTIPYGDMWGRGHRRPNGKMSLKQHQDVGQLIKAVLESDARPWTVHTRLGAIRSKLEDWCSYEVPSEQLENIDFFDIYYKQGSAGHRYSKLAKTPAGVGKLLTKLKAILLQSYPDCGPLRQLNQKIDASTKFQARFEMCGK